MISFIGFCLVIYCAFYGSYANPLWKRHQESSYYANGLLVTTRTKRAAEIGWDGAAMEWMDENARKNRAASNSGIFAETPTAEEPSYSKPEKEAWYEDEHGNKKPLQLNSDGSMFKDPYTGEWRKLND